MIYNSLPYKKVSNKKINSILIGLPTIDRDITKASKMYDSLMKSINTLQNSDNVFGDKLTIDICIITRETDVNMINFWKDKAKIYLVPHYEITNRHNWNKIVETFNILANNSLSYDVLTIVESDVYLQSNSLLNMLNKLSDNHVSLAYGNIPWAGYPVIVIPGWISPKIINGKPSNDNIRILGHWTGAVTIRTEVFDTCKFNYGSFQGIVGQDVGFYQQLFKNRFKVLLTEYVEHDYQ